MPRPRGQTATRVQPNSRAIVREAEWMVMPERIANELKPLVKLANDQGWKIEAAQGGNRLIWRGPAGEGPIYTGYRCRGHDLAKWRGELVRAGLKLDESQAKAHVTDTEFQQLLETNATATTDDILNALSLITGNVAIYAAKAQEVDNALNELKEWRDMAHEAVEEVDRVRKKLSEADTMLDAIRECFSLAPWAILPEIAKLLGIDSNPIAVRPVGPAPVPAIQRVSNA